MEGFSGATGVPLKQMQDAIAQSTAKIFFKEFDVRGVAINQAEDGKYYAQIDISSIPSQYYILSAVWKTSYRTPVRMSVCSAPPRLFLISDTQYTIPNVSGYVIRVYYSTITPSE